MRQETQSYFLKYSAQLRGGFLPLDRKVITAGHVKHLVRVFWMLVSRSGRAEE